MQIHELTQRRRVDEGAMDSANAAVGKLGSALKTGAQYAGDAAVWLGAGQRTAAGQISYEQRKFLDTAYKSWVVYRQQLDKSTPTGQADPNLVSTQLLTFISKNLLNGKQINSLQNQNVIMTLAKEISNAPANKQKELFTKLVQVTKAPSAASASAAPLATTPTPGASAFGQMANQLGGTAGATSKGGTATTTPTGIRHTASTNNPKQIQPAVTGVATTPATTPTGQRFGKIPKKATAMPPITVGKEKIKPTDPRYAALANAIKQESLEEALNKELARLFTGLI
jgi:hypothetical protein